MVREKAPLQVRRCLCVLQEADHELEGVAVEVRGGVVAAAGGDVLVDDDLVDVVDGGGAADLTD